MAARVDGKKIYIFPQQSATICANGSGVWFPSKHAQNRFPTTNRMQVIEGFFSSSFPFVGGNITDSSRDGTVAGHMCGIRGLGS